MATKRNFMMEVSVFTFRLFYLIIFPYDSDKLKYTIAEILDLTIDEVGDCMELVYTPVRADGLKGSPKTLISSPVSPGISSQCKASSNLLY